MNVAEGMFGAWHETALHIHLALLAGGVRREGYGRSLGRMIWEDGVTLPTIEELEASIRAEPGHPLTAARADLLRAMRVHGLQPGRTDVTHRWKQASIVAQAFRAGGAKPGPRGIGPRSPTNTSLFHGA